MLGVQVSTCRGRSTFTIKQCLFLRGVTMKVNISSVVGLLAVSGIVLLPKPSLAQYANGIATVLDVSVTNPPASMTRVSHEFILNYASSGTSSNVAAVGDWWTVQAYAYSMMSSTIQGTYREKWQWEGSTRPPSCTYEMTNGTWASATSVPWYSASASATSGPVSVASPNNTNVDTTTGTSPINNSGLATINCTLGASASVSH